MGESCVQALFEGPIDVIGDVHGELAALEVLLRRLGYDAEGRHSEGRRLVFVGDLVDRGPDSPGVLRLVQRLVEAGRAQCIVGNHELNALRNDAERGRPGEGWWYGRFEERYGSAVVSEREKEQAFLPFLRSLPAALEREELRVVHACWDEPSIELLRGRTSVIDTFHEQREALAPRLEALKLSAREAWRRAGLTPRALHDEATQAPFLPELAEHDERNQMGNAVKVVTSGVERVARETFWASGKWRMVERVRWWDEYDGPDVVVGHYWRRYRSEMQGNPEKSRADLFGEHPPERRLGPAGRVMCIDYSVGFRFHERARARNEGAFEGCLAALRVPEWTLVFDDGRAVLNVEHDDR